MLTNIGLLCDDLLAGGLPRSDTICYLRDISDHSYCIFRDHTRRVLLVGVLRFISLLFQHLLNG